MFLVTTDMCCYGTRWKKPTRLLLWGPQASGVRLPTCTGRKGGAHSANANTNNFLPQFRALTASKKGPGVHEKPRNIPPGSSRLFLASSCLAETFLHNCCWPYRFLRCRSLRALPVAHLFVVSSIFAFVPVCRLRSNVPSLGTSSLHGGRRLSLYSPALRSTPGGQCRIWDPQFGA